MFKSLFSFVESGDAMPQPGSDVDQVLTNLKKFAFYPQLSEVCRKLYGKSADELLAEKKGHEIIEAIIDGTGLNYGQLPKGLLEFHSYPEGSRTPLEEHIAEGAQTAVLPGGTLHLHFTVSPAHRKLFEKKLHDVIPEAEDKYNIRIDVTLSEQKPFTDTIAANPDGTPFRQSDGSLLFRPGGHGALIENLSDIDSAVIFIKNIDNVVPDQHRDITVRWKQILGGVLVEAHDRIVAYTKLLRQGADRELLDKVVKFFADTMQTTIPGVDKMSDKELTDLLLAKLNRPLRVCGMVVNEGEPGGGPYIAENPDGTASPQILESTQIAPEYKHLMEKATHFNPVDLVCYTQDPDGNPYDLRKFVDHATGFISSKSSQGRELRALELPGLWNGAMSDWNTIFVQVPAATFNPVKTVNDLLRPAHQ